MLNTEKSKETDIKARVLLAEDDAISKILLLNVLKKIDCEIVPAQNGQEAIEKYQEQNFDLVIMDVTMPVMDGFEAASRIRELEGKTRYTPIIALTAHVFREVGKRCCEAGMDDYITKPINIKDFLQKVSTLLQSAKRKDHDAIEGDNR